MNFICIKIPSNRRQLLKRLFSLSLFLFLLSFFLYWLVKFFSLCHSQTLSLSFCLLTRYAYIYTYIYFYIANWCYVFEINSKDTLCKFRSFSIRSLEELLMQSFVWKVIDMCVLDWSLPLTVLSSRNRSSYRNFHSSQPRLYETREYCPLSHPTYFCSENECLRQKSNHRWRQTILF